MMRSDRNFLLTRSIMLALSIAISAVLLATSHVIIGLLFAAMAIARIAMLFSMRKRRSEVRERFQTRAAGGRGRGAGRRAVAPAGSQRSYG